VPVNSKIPYRLVKLLCVLWLLPLAVSAGEWKKVKTLTLKAKVSTVSIDRYGLFYIADEEGNIFKYDSTGTELLTYSPPKKADVTLMEAWRNVNIFVYYRNFQEFVLLDRFLSPSPQTRLESSDIGFGRLATFSYDNNIWVIDETDFSLKKYSLTFNRIELHTPLDLLLDLRHYDMNFIREYQNLVYINDKNSGVLIFDNMGNYKTRIPVKNLPMLGFFNDEIYFQDQDKIRFINIYTYAERTIDLPVNKPYQYLLYSGSRLYLFDGKTVEVYRKD
jgi:hypothetical protein